MKVVSSKEMAFIESEAYRNGSTEDDFMEQAGKGVSFWIDDYIVRNNLQKIITLLCGKGNNAGDAYVAGSYLLEQGYKVQAYQITPIACASPLCMKNYQRFLEKGGQVIGFNHEEEIFLENSSVLVDALFGTGFKGVAKGIFADVIKKANQSRIPIIAVDIPSGLDGETGIFEGEAIKAEETIFLGLPKMGFFLQDGWNLVGKLRFVDFGLPKQYIEEFEAEFNMLSKEVVKNLFPPIVRNRHKYQAGNVVGMAGSPGMPGAAMLASLGAIRGGAGIVHLLHPEKMVGELTCSPYELIKISYSPNDDKKVIDTINGAKAVFIGPGIGKADDTRRSLQKILPNIEVSCVIDADALTIIAEENIKLPQKSILTPHFGEMIRLLKTPYSKSTTKEFLQTCQNFAEENVVTLILKGGPTFIFHPKEKIMVSPVGDPGMATAGSGDVLTGIIAAFLAQGLTPKHAAYLSVYLHGKAGEFAAQEMTSYCMMASDIIKYLPITFR